MSGHRLVSRVVGLVLAAGALGLAAPNSGAAPVPAKAAAGFGTYLKPFAADSLWNSRPSNPVFGDFAIPTSDYAPAVSEAWSTGVFVAGEGDPPMVIRGPDGKAGVWDPDAEEQREVTIPRWPANVAAAKQLDGHADIIDPIDKVIHSFWQLKKVDGRWTSTLYAWSPLNGRGWGDPAHYFQGGRAAGVPTSGGLIRTHELNDGESMYHHALAMSLTLNALSADPTFIYPATSADHDAAKVNSGKIPEGALMMLPPAFDAQKLTIPALRKVAETLKVHGAWVVDRNTGTPFDIYVEIGSGFNLHGAGWSNPAAADLDAIRLALRQVVSSDGWIDGNGRRFTPDRNLNMLSLRGPWVVQGGGAQGVFQTRKQAVVFPTTSSPIVQMNDTGRGLNAVPWALPVVGRSYRVTAITTGGAKLRIVLRNKADGREAYDSGELANGEAKTFSWPANGAFVAYAISGTGQVSTVGGSLVALDRGKS